MQIPQLQILGKTEDWSYTRKSCDSVIVRSRVTAPLMDLWMNKTEQVYKVHL